MLLSLDSDWNTSEKKLLFSVSWILVWTNWGAYQLCIWSRPTTLSNAIHLKGFELTSKYSQSSLFAGVRFLENPMNTENANTELFHLHFHYARMPILITKIIKNESCKNKEAASPCWSRSATLRGRHFAERRRMRGNKMSWMERICLQCQEKWHISRRGTQSTSVSTEVNFSS